MLVVSGLTPTKTERREGNTTEGGLWRRWRVAGDSGKLYRKRQKRKLKKKKGNRAKQKLRRQRGNAEEGQEATLKKPEGKQSKKRGEKSRRTALRSKKIKRATNK